MTVYAWYISMLFTFASESDVHGIRKFTHCLHALNDTYFVLKQPQAEHAVQVI